jgi:hypothetical protein
MRSSHGTVFLGEMPSWYLIKALQKQIDKELIQRVTDHGISVPNACSTCCVLRHQQILIRNRETIQYK